MLPLLLPLLPLFHYAGPYILHSGLGIGFAPNITGEFPASLPTASGRSRRGYAGMS